MLRDGRIDATDSQVSDELRGLRDLEMIEKLPKEWRRWPYRWVRSDAWDLIKVARSLASHWQGGRNRRLARGRGGRS